jgi:outer membrane receptor protein involved in Fe transport
VIPGAAAILDTSTSNQQARGLGAGGARVLVDGQRFPGKANDLAANLRRIPASAVERVELISDTAADISV